MGCFKRTASKHVYYQGWNRSPAQVGCMRQVLRLGALGRPGGSRWRGRWERGSGWGTHVNPRTFHFNVWQNSLQIKKKKFKKNDDLTESMKYSTLKIDSCWLGRSHVLDFSRSSQLHVFLFQQRVFINYITMYNNGFNIFILFIYFWLGCVACGILVPWSGIKPVPPALEAWIHDHWTNREVPW